MSLIAAASWQNTPQISFTSAAALSPQVEKYAVEEIKVCLTARFRNPFDPTDIALDASIQAPSGKIVHLPGFFYRPYTFRLVAGKEVDSPAGPGDWRVRFCPTEAGLHKITLRAKDHAGHTATRVLTVKVNSSTNPGFIRLSPQDKRFFQFDSGVPYYPVGMNIAWGGDHGVLSYDQWIPKSGSQGLNYARYWLGPLWATFALEVAGKAEENKGLGQFNLADCARLDHAIDLARKNGVYVMLTLDSYNMLREKDGYPQWSGTPHNHANGGPLKRPEDYFTDTTIQKLYESRLRYLVARYSAYTNVFSWEFWNEVDLTGGFKPSIVRDWHAKQAQALHRLDPYQHLLSTSFSSSAGTPMIDALPELDFVQSHIYATDFVRQAAQYQTVKGAHKAHFVGEVGADGGSPRPEDKEGIQLHDALWVGITNGMSGTAMTWWWDNLVDPNNLYHLFKPVHEFVKDIDWPRQGFTPVPLAVNGPQSQIDLAFAEGPGGVSNSPWNRPSKITIANHQVRGDLPVAGLLHGTRNHGDIHNPITFDVDNDIPYRFVLTVGDVSGWGGAKLEISLDGKKVVTRDFADPDDQQKTGNLTQYKGDISVPVPAGHHVLVVNNPGNDWFVVSYRFEGLKVVSTPPVDTYAVQGKSVAIAWVLNRGRNFHSLVELKTTPAPVSGLSVSFPHLGAGTWSVAVWDTWTGTVVATQTVHSDGKTSEAIPLPPVGKDFALKLVKRF